MEDGGEERFEDEVPGGQALDDAHGAPAARTRPGRSWRRGDERFGRRCWGDRDRLTTGGQPERTSGWGEEAEVADADEALRQHVQEKASEKLVGVEREGADLAPMPIILPPKGDRVVGDGDESMIRDRDAVGVAREVVQA